MKWEEFGEEFVELLGFELSQEFAKASPKDTGRMAKAFTTTLEVDDTKLRWTVPFYWEFVEFGTVKMPARPFVRTILEKDTEKIADKVINIISKR